MTTERLIEATCPECRGPLTEISDGDIVEYRCLVEHRYSALAVLEAHSDTQERALWAAALALEEAGVLAEAVAAHLPSLREALGRQADEKRRLARQVREVLEQLEPFTTESLI